MCVCVRERKGFINKFKAPQVRGLGFWRTGQFFVFLLAAAAGDGALALGDK